MKVLTTSPGAANRELQHSGNMETGHFHGLHVSTNSAFVQWDIKHTLGNSVFYNIVRGQKNPQTYEDLEQVVHVGFSSSFLIGKHSIN